MKTEFDYQSKVWGTAVVSASPFSLAGLRFSYFLASIQGVYGKVLEVGCGAGGNLQALRKYRPYLELYGVDIGEAAIREGQRRFPRLHLSVAPAEKLPFPDNSFAIVCFFDVLEHVQDPEVCLKEAARVLQPGGVLHAYVPCEGEALTLHGFLNRQGINLKEKTAGHIQQLTRAQLIAMSTLAGLQVKEVYWSCHPINQIGDLLYYWYLTLSGKRLENSLEGSIGSKQGVLSLVLTVIKSLVSLVWYIESSLLWWFPGAGVHITCIKQKM